MISESELPLLRQRMGCTPADDVAYEAITGRWQDYLDNLQTTRPLWNEGIQWEPEKPTFNDFLIGMKITVVSVDDFGRVAGFAYIRRIRAMYDRTKEMVFASTSAYIVPGDNRSVGLSRIVISAVHEKVCSLYKNSGERRPLLFFESMIIPETDKTGGIRMGIGRILMDLGYSQPYGDAEYLFVKELEPCV